MSNERKWFKLIMYESIPIIGLIYMIILLKNKNTNISMKTYIKIKLKIKIINLILTIILIIILYNLALKGLDMFQSKI